MRVTKSGIYIGRGGVHWLFVVPFIGFVLWAGLLRSDPEPLVLALVIIIPAIILSGHNEALEREHRAKRQQEIKEAERKAIIHEITDWLDEQENNAMAAPLDWYAISRRIKQKFL